jgi:hypothetical protein
MQGFRHAAIHLALAAMILRAFLPAGWMPNTQPGGSALVICTMDGAVQNSADKKDIAGKNDPRAHESCPFAAAAQPAPAQDFIALAAPELSRQAAPRHLASGLEARRTAFLKPASRAPPALT